MLQREAPSAQATGSRRATAPPKKAVAHVKSASKRPGAMKPKVKPPGVKPKSDRKPRPAARKIVKRASSR
jgi:hypothetical protein